MLYGVRDLIDYSYLFDLARNTYGHISYNDKLGHAVLPLRYTFEITYRCNLQCPYCYVGNDRNKNELATQDWFNVINQIPRYSFISLLGGEPLLREDFLEIFENAAKHTFGKVNIISNGILLNEKIIDSFIKNRLLLLSVSLDGFGKNHDTNRQKEGIFDKITSNLDILNSKRKKRKPLIDIKTVLLENNLDDLPKLYKYCSDNNFEFFSIAFKRNNALKQNSTLRESFGEEFYQEIYPLKPYFDMNHFKEVYKELMSLSKNGNTKLRWAPKFKPRGNVKVIEDFFNLGDKPVQEIYKPCYFPFSNIFINSEGDVYPCLSVKIGNIKDKPLKEVCNTPQFCCFRKNLKASKLFSGCQLCCELIPKNL